MFGFNRRRPELVQQYPLAEPAASTWDSPVTPSDELYGLDLILWAQSQREPEHRNLDLIDRVLDERLAVSRALAPVGPGRPS